MIERLLKSWTRVPLIVERDFPLIVDWLADETWLAPSLGGLPASPRLQINPIRASPQTGRPPEKARFAVPFLLSASKSRLHAAGAVSPRFKEKFHDSREITPCSTVRKYAVFAVAQSRVQGKTTIEARKRASDAPTTARPAPDQGAAAASEVADTPHFPLDLPGGRR